MFVAASVAVDPRSRSTPGTQQLQVLGLVGTIPPKLFRLPNLIELNVEVNSLTGELPEKLCDGDSQLQILSVRRNALSGSAVGVQSCESLVHLDLSVSSAVGYHRRLGAW